MALRLNKLHDDIRLAQCLQNALRRVDLLKSRLEKADSGDRKELIDAHEAMAAEQYDVACSSYQQEKGMDEVRVHLRAAAEHSFHYFRLLRPPTEREMRQFYLFEKLLNLLICFGTPDMRQKSASIPKEIYHFTSGSHYKDTYAPFPPYLGIIEYLELLKKIAAAAAWDESAYQRAKAYCVDDKATKWERDITLPKLESTRAAIHGDANTWNDKIAEIVKWHKHEATRGDWKHSAEAFLCLPGLAMAQLGLQRGLACTVKSPYLPLQLLKEDA